MNVRQDAGQPGADQVAYDRRLHPRHWLYAIVMPVLMFILIFELQGISPFFWSKTQGTAERAEVEQHNSSRRGWHYDVYVNYSYSVNGQLYHNRAQNNDPLAEWHFDEQGRDQDRADSITQNRPAIIVYYNPSKPQESVINRTPGLKTALSPWFAIMVAFTLSDYLWLGRRRRRNVTANGAARSDVALPTDLQLPGDSTGGAQDPDSDAVYRGMLSAAMILLVIIGLPIAFYFYVNRANLNKKFSDTELKADIQADSHHYQKAIDNFTALLKLPHNDDWRHTYPTWYERRGDCYEALGNHKMAQADYERALQLSLHKVSLLSDRGDHFENAGNHEKAIASYTTAITLSSEGAALAGITRHADREDYAAPDDPTQSDLYLKRGSSYLNLGACEDDVKGERHSAQDWYKNAVGDLTQSLQLNPQSSEAFSTRGIAYFDLGDYKKAISDDSEAIKLDPTNADALTERADAYQAIGAKVKAKADRAAARRLSN